MYELGSQYQFFVVFLAPRKKKSKKRGEDTKSPDPQGRLSPFQKRRQFKQNAGSSSDEDADEEAGSRGRLSPRQGGPLFSASRKGGRSRSKSPMRAKQQIMAQSPDGLFIRP